MASSARRRMRDGFAAGQITLDGLEMPAPTAPAGDDVAQTAFAAHAAALEATYAAGDDAWADSRYAWIRNLAPARRGKVAGQLVDRWLTAAGVDVAPRLSPDHD